ncbi:glycine cleavage system aminomethyltransferase GcvT [Halovenus sp. WSH3]|uniref:Probable aminomethyltransferase n=1 Tax=Halovenus carboxidivorans TaxID=2692199 RepID=A0A6B0T550_9EURY|nr:glycine cleavage system aminomethyltransferase GcvT [Halovenus carboxidivorans]MXR50673.1 glycine cleavage system aminomethyltransferase GcvT [Halovenus carboxidivorans]
MSLRQPPIEHSTKQTDFGGWEMPVEFDSIRTEHTAVREAVGKFDVSHMGEITVSGPDATRLLQRLTTNDVADLEPGEGQYAAITDESGIMLDDTVVYRLPEAESETFLFIPNAGHDEEITEWATSHRDQWGFEATVTNRTEEYAMIAVQGPDSPDVLGENTDVDLSELSRFEITDGTVAGAQALVARTGYTGEQGFELLCPWSAGQEVWTALECQPCGLGARDTLRLEMGFLLSGQDFDPEENPRNPYEAGIGFTVKLDTEFLGRDALEGVDVEGPEEKLIGLVMRERGVPRAGYAVETPSGEQIGEVTSGTMSPTLGDPIALAYLPAEYAGEDRTVRIVVRGEPKKARTTTTPFLS